MNIADMCTFIEQYIYHRKGVVVNITPSSGEQLKIIAAYNYAIKWFNKHKV